MCATFQTKVLQKVSPKTQSSQINNHLAHHLSQPTHLGTKPEATKGTRELTMYITVKR